LGSIQHKNRVSHVKDLIVLHRVKDILLGLGHFFLWSTNHMGSVGSMTVFSTNSHSSCSSNICTRHFHGMELEGSSNLSLYCPTGITCWMKLINNLWQPSITGPLCFTQAWIIGISPQKLPRCFLWQVAALLSIQGFLEGFIKLL